ncbi:hypothetical protein B7494_g259 [Chlorociboria aeruginascens]|nr:hypothetical protein B7494_g259 [Chlorociboria aeruginascens]
MDSNYDNTSYQQDDTGYQADSVYQPVDRDISVAEALEIARGSPEGAEDPIVKQVLENAISEIWAKISANPTAYVMTRDEFAVFNYFQIRFKDNQVAVSAIKRYWDNLRVNNGYH